MRGLCITHFLLYVKRWGVNYMDIVQAPYW